MTVKLEAGELATGAQRDHTFTSRVLSATVELSSFELAYAPVGDHHVEAVDASVRLAAVAGPTVSVHAEGAIRDSSGNSGGGTIGYLLIAEVE
jgi:hypothetical protein